MCHSSRLNVFFMCRAEFEQLGCSRSCLSGEGRFARLVPPECREVRPFKAKPGHVLTPQGEILAVPDGWALLPPGDAALSRRIKADGPCWVVRQPKGRKVFSHGIWAPAERIDALRIEREAERDDPAYQKRLDAGRQRRAKAEVEYQDEFHAAVFGFLNFAQTHEPIAIDMARRIVAHAVPVGSGTVARTKRISVEARAEAATIAWMRHQTTGYDSMTIPREKGRRREVRRMLAQRSKQLLARYRRGEEVDVESCPLARALAKD